MSGAETSGAELSSAESAAPKWPSLNKRVSLRKQCSLNVGKVFMPIKKKLKFQQELEKNDSIHVENHCTNT